MRIVAGKYRGRKIEAVQGRMTRPLMGRVREALFNILGSKVEGVLVWDLFAGTGASGLEAMSRGARAVAFVERGKQALNVLKRNLSILEQDHSLDSEFFRVLRGDAWCPRLPLQGGPLSKKPGLIFLDPPYPQVRKDRGLALKKVAALLGHLEGGGTLIFHFPKGVYEIPVLEELGEVDLRSWGDAAVCLLSPRKPSQ
jgi:16S rRNA (guanine966-N2)-methyltransferase